jgi:DNA-binding NtrC family response regulator
MTATKETSGGICLVEDDAIMGEALSRFFELEHLPCDWFRTLETARAALRSRHYCALVSDICLPDGDGGELYRELTQEPAHLPPTLFITAYGSVAQAVDLLKLGARDYITKPFEPDELMVKLRRACPKLFEPGCRAAGRPCWACRGDAIASSSCWSGWPATVSRCPDHGESGVGKEHAARYLHACRTASDGPPFVGVNCAAVPEDLIEAELFGVERGAYTGSVAARRVSSSRQGRAPCSSTRSARCPWGCKRSC